MNLSLAQLTAVAMLLSSPFAAGRAQNSQTNLFRCPAEEVNRIDQTVARILSFTEVQRQFPERIPEIAPFCNKTRFDVKELVGLYPRCLNGTSKNFASIILYSLKKTVNLYCNMKNTKRINSIVLMGKCVNKNENSAQRCLHTYMDNLVRGKRAEIVSNRIGYACCPYFELLHCLDTTLKCSQKSIESINDFVRNLFQSIIDAACGDFVENSDRCDRLPAPPKKKKTDVAWQTFLLPLLELWYYI